MVVRRSTAEAVSDNVKTESVEMEAAAAETSQVEEPAGDAGGFCVYIGPSIRGVIQSGMIYGGSKEKMLAHLAPAVENYPLIEKLISTEKTFVEDRIKVKTAGNVLNVYYNQLAGKSN